MRFISLASLLMICAVCLLTSVPLATAQATQPASALPPDEQGAAAAIKASPRHGEFVDVPLEGQTAKLRCFIVYPERAEKAPVVIVIHEIFGLSDWVRGVTDQLAADGFIAIAPDFLSGMGPNGGGTESFTGDAMRNAIRGIKPEDVERRLNAARAYAIALPASNGKSATVGFCWGGSASFEYATRQPELNAAVVYYGTGPKDEAQLTKIHAPVLGFYGQDDARVTQTVEPSKQAMTSAGKKFDARIYDGAGHGFLRQQSGRDGANARASQQAWAETIRFLREHTR